MAIVKNISALPPLKKLAFAAICGERVLAELKDLKHKIKGYEFIRKGLDIVWKVAGGEKADIVAAQKTYDALRKAIPIDEDTNNLVVSGAAAAGRPLLMITERSKAHGLAVMTSDEMVGLVELVSENSKAARTKEEAWQENMLTFLKSYNGPLTPKLVKAVPEYKREKRQEG